MQNGATLMRRGDLGWGGNAGRFAVYFNTPGFLTDKISADDIKANYVAVDNINDYLWDGALLPADKVAERLLAEHPLAVSNLSASMLNSGDHNLVIAAIAAQTGHRFDDQDSYHDEDFPKPMSWDEPEAPAPVDEPVRNPLTDLPKTKAFAALKEAGTVILTSHVGFTNGEPTAITRNRMIGIPRAVTDSRTEGAVAIDGSWVSLAGKHKKTYTDEATGEIVIQELDDDGNPATEMRYMVSASKIGPAVYDPAGSRESKLRAIHQAGTGALWTIANAELRAGHPVNQELAAAIGHSREANAATLELAATHGGYQAKMNVVGNKNAEPRTVVAIVDTIQAQFAENDKKLEKAAAEFLEQYADGADKATLTGLHQKVRGAYGEIHQGNVVAGEGAQRIAYRTRVMDNGMSVGKRLIDTHLDHVARINSYIASSVIEVDELMKAM
ncbi:hypothetical protein ASF30_12490 [Leifsonia sp. Leaf264]|nr:hypothetical protein ASF30_12490 [Leifsonia sp. Leaf264]